MDYEIDNSNSNKLSPECMKYLKELNIPIDDYDWMTPNEFLHERIYLNLRNIYYWFDFGTVELAKIRTVRLPMSQGDVLARHISRGNTNPTVLYIAPKCD